MIVWILHVNICWRFEHSRATMIFISHINSIPQMEILLFCAVWSWITNLLVSHRESVRYQITKSINAIRLFYTREMWKSWFENHSPYWYRLPVLLGQFCHLNHMQRVTDKWAFIREATDHLFAVYLLILRMYVLNCLVASIECDWLAVWRLKIIHILRDVSYFLFLSLNVTDLDRFWSWIFKNLPGSANVESRQMIHDTYIFVQLNEQLHNDCHPWTYAVH